MLWLAKSSRIGTICYKAVMGNRVDDTVVSTRLGRLDQIDAVFGTRLIGVSPGNSP